MGVYLLFVKKAELVHLQQSTTYATGNDPASSYTFGMQQVYNASVLNTAPHSKNWLFD